jgi:hypothetical protein
MLLPYVLIVRGEPFLYPEGSEAMLQGGFFYQSLVSWIENPAILRVIAILLIFIEAWLLNHIVNRNRLERNLSSLAGLIYILLMSAIPLFLGMTPVILANLFLLFGFQAIFKIYKKPLSAIFIFNAGLMFGLASLIYRPYMVMLILGLMGVIILNTINLKRLFQLLIGFLMSYVFCYTYFLNIGVGPGFLLDIWVVKWSNPFPMDVAGYLLLGIMGLLILITLLSYNSYMVKKSIQAQQKMDLFYWFMMLSLPGVFMMAQMESYMITVLAIPLGALLHINVQKFKPNFVAEILHLLVVIGILSLQYSVHLL